MRLPRLRAEQWLFGATALVLALLILPPIAALVRASLFVGEIPGQPSSPSLGAYKEIFTSPRLGDLVGTTFAFAAGSTLVGLILGGTLAWGVERTNAPLRQLAYPFIFVSFAVPAIIRAIGWIFLLGPGAGTVNDAFRALTGTKGVLIDVFSLPAMVLVQGIAWIPLVFLMMAATFHSMDPSLEEAASMSGATTWRTVRRVTAALALPSILSVVLLTFIRSIQAFEVPLLLGVPGHAYTITTEVYLSVTSGVVPDYSYPSAYGVLLVAFLAVGIAFYGRVTRQAARFATITGKGFRPRLLDLGRGRWVVTAILLAILLLQFLPILELLAASFLPTFGLSGPPWAHLTLANYRTILASPGITRSIVNSFEIGVASATAIVILAAVIAWLLVRSRIRAIGLLDQLASLPLVLPGVVLGIAVLVLYIRSPIAVYGTIWIFVIAFTIAYVPFGLRYTHPGILGIHPELEESAQLSGAAWVSMFRRIVVPLLIPALFAGWIFVFLLSVRELSIAAFLYTQSSPVIATTLLDLWDNGELNQVTAFGTVVAVLSIAVALITYRVSRRFGLNV